jgi:hypothetical protein
VEEGFMQDRHATDADQIPPRSARGEDRLMRRLEVGSGRLLLVAVVIFELACLAVVVALVL